MKRSRRFQGRGFFVLLKVVGQCKNQGDFHELRGLQCKRADNDPTLGSGDDAAKEQYINEPEEGERIARVSKADQCPIIKQEDHGRGNDSKEQPPQLLYEKGGVQRTTDSSGSAIDGKNPGSDQGKSCDQESPVQIAQ